MQSASRLRLEHRPELVEHGLKLVDRPLDFTVFERTRVGAELVGHRVQSGHPDAEATKNLGRRNRRRLGDESADVLHDAAALFVGHQREGLAVVRARNAKALMPSEPCPLGRAE